MSHYPVFFAVTRPEKFDRVQIAVRVVILAVLSMVGLTMGALFSLLYLVLPTVAAVMLSQGGAARFLGDGSPRIARSLRWVMSAFAYLALLTDRTPGSEPHDGVRFAIEPGAWPSSERRSDRPTAGGALMRLVYSLPSALVLGILGIAFWIVWLAAALMILISEDYPKALYDFQCGVLRWQARLLAYHASLVEAYPPFAVDVGQVPSSGSAPLVD